jgi:uncharacterized membrane protein
VSTPLHPAVVHIPLGLAFLAPLVAFGVLIAVWRGLLPWRAWLIVVLLQVLMLGAGLVARQSGESDGDRIEKALGKQAVNEHEESAERFLWVTAGMLALSLLALPLGTRRYGKLVMALAALATLGGLGMGIRAGHSGGELIYEHNAAQALKDAGGSKMTFGGLEAEDHDRDRDPRDSTRTEDGEKEEAERR